MRKLGLVVVLSLVAISVAAADEAKKKDMPAPQPAEAKAMRAPEPPPAPPQPAPTTPPKPGPEQAALGPLAQNWTCQGTAKDPATNTDVAYKSSWKAKPDLNKLWLAIEYKQDIKSKPPMKFTGHGFMGWDSSSKSYLFGGVDDWGGHIALSSTGWDAAGKTIVFTGDASGPPGKMPMRMTFTKGDTDKQLLFKIEVQAPGGKDWMQVQSETCKR